MMKKILMSLILLAGVSLGLRGEERPENSDQELARLLASVESRNLRLREMRHEMEATGYDLKERNSLDNTSVEYSPFFRRGAAGVASSELIVSQEFDFPTLYAARAKAGKQQMAAMEQQYLLELRDLMIKATEEYINLVRLRQTENALSRQLSDADRLLSLFNKKLELGEATAIDVNRIRMRQSELNLELAGIRREIAAANSAVSMLNGYEYFNCEALQYPAWTFSSTGIDVDNDAEVKLAASEVETLRSEERVACQSWVPKLTLGYRRNTELDEASNGLIVGASFPLFSTSARVKGAKARKAAAEVQMENVRKKVAAEAASAEKDLGILAQSLKDFNRPLLDNTEVLLNKSLEAGVITLTDYYSELSDLNGRRMAYIDLEYEYYSTLCVLYKNALTTYSK